MPDEELIFRGAFDVPSDEDFLADDIVGQELGAIPDELDLLAGTGYTAKNQGNSVKCTSFGLTSNHEVLNRREHNKPLVFDPDTLWKYMVDAGLTSSAGSSLQSALKTLLKKGSQGDKIYAAKGYAKVDGTYDDFKNYLAQGYPIYTGSKVTTKNFALAKTTGIWGALQGEMRTGHAFFAVGYGKIPGDGRYGIKMMNSYGNWGKWQDGSFWVLREDVPLLYTGYIVYDVLDLKPIFKDVMEDDWAAKEIKEALTDGVMIGEDAANIPDPKDRNFFPNRPVTRRELAVVYSRIKKVLG